MSLNIEAADDSGLRDKVVIVTGGGALDDGIGNGRAAALLLARSGTKVLVADRQIAAAQATVAMIEQDGGIAAAFAGDVTDEEDCRKMVDAAMNQFGRLDFLDNNVGIGSRGSVVDEKPDTYRTVMRVN
ncbi:MAG: SDR family NAD(P)-dependent oxidoreductase, partial [Rhodospirillaceae bacterium]|nr:SDR family NAD(P)-dependent oxidoreductase [Rhodospirillaceae bacterium]